MDDIAAHARQGDAANTDAEETGCKAVPLAEMGWRYAMRNAGAS